MRPILALLLLAGCTTTQQSKPMQTQAPLEGHFLLQEVAQPTTTSPQSFPAEDWAKGLTLAQNPSSITLQQGQISATGVLALSGHVTGEIQGQMVQFTVAEEDQSTRLEIQFQGVYNPAKERIEGKITQRWELVGDDETGGVTLTGKASFVRKEP
jgi:hypothetical protein